VGGTKGVPETAAAFSTGGFSAIFTRPSYQATAVGNYLNRIAPLYAGKFNPNGRAFPDVATQAQNIEMVNGSAYITAYGTSAASPIFASIIALLNDRRIATGKSVLGFLNPALYANPGVLNDITSGSNPGCGTNGFPSISGWDAVTGLGTPNYGALARLAGV
jgi:tripeptidyl-peptidase I